MYRPLVEEDVGRAAARFVEAGIEAVAVILINSHANPAHELAAERLLRKSRVPGRNLAFHRVTGEFREYERVPRPR